MPSRSKKRREAAITVCSLKRRHETLAAAGRAARLIRDSAENIAAKRVAPYLCPNGGDHYHIGRNMERAHRIRDIERRQRVGLQISRYEADLAGLTLVGREIA